MTRLPLTTNQRVLRGGTASSPEALEFVQWLQRVGDGKEEKFADALHKDLIRVPPAMLVDSLPDLLAFVFPDFADEDAVATAAVLTPLKVNASMINDVIIDGLPGNAVFRYSFDQASEGAFLEGVSV